MTAKSDRVQRLLDDPDLQQAFEDVRKAIHTGWEQERPTDVEAQKEWHRRLHTLRSVEENLRLAIQDGHLADFRAQEEDKVSFLKDLRSWKVRK